MKKIILATLICTFLNLLGCYSYQALSREELNQAKERGDLLVKTKTKNQYVYEFEKGKYTVSEDSISGSGNVKLIKDKKVYYDEEYVGSIQFKDIETLKMYGFDMIGTILVIAIPVAAIIITAATFSPFKKGKPLLSE